MITLALSFLTNLAAIALILIAAAGLACPLLHKVKFGSRIERLIFTLAIGLGLWAVLLLLLSLVGLLYRELILGLTAIAVFWSIAHLAASHRRPIPRFSHLRLSAGNRAQLILLTLAACASGYWVVLFLLAQMPPVQWDATAYHLVLAREHLAQHGFAVHTGVQVPIAPPLNHMLFSWGLALKGAIIPQLIEHSLLVLTCLAMYAWGVRQQQPVWGAAAAFFFSMSPLVTWLAGSAYVDIGITCFAFVGVYALHVFWDEKDAKWWVIGMFLFGIGAGIKLPGLFFLGIGGLIGLAACVRGSLSIKNLVVGGGIALCVVAPCYFVIASHTGNPVWPAMAQWSRDLWGGQPVVEWNNWINSVGLPKTVSNFLVAPFVVALKPERFLPDNNFAFSRLLLAWPLSLVVLPFNRSVRWWSLWAMVYFAFWFFSSQQLRFLLPALPLMILALCESLRWLVERSLSSARFRNTVPVLLSVLFVFNGARLSLPQLRRVGLNAITPAGRAAFLTNNFAGFPGLIYVNDNARTGETVYTINASWLSYYFKPKVIDAMGLLQRTTWPTFKGRENKEWLNMLESKEVAWIFVYHAGLPPWWQKPTSDPNWRPDWTPYELVYEDQSAWIYRHRTGKQ